MQHDLKAAMSARDRATVAVLRTTLAALSNAEAVSADGSRPRLGAFANEVDRRTLDDDDIRAVIVREREELAASADDYQSLGQRAEAAGLRQQVGVLDRYLET